MQKTIKFFLPEASLKAFQCKVFQETNENVLIEGLEVFKDFLVISKERSNGLKKPKLYPFESRGEVY